MSEDSLESSRPQLPRAKRGGLEVLIVTGLALLAFLLPSLLLAPLEPLVASLPIQPNAKVFIGQTSSQLLTIGLLYGILRARQERFADLGLGKFKLRYLGVALVALPIYFYVSMLAVSLITTVFSVPEQAQELGFRQPQGWELLAVFIPLVIVAPIMEELIFRGFLLRTYIQQFGAWLAVAAVSLLFALAHGNVAVGIDVFVLSLALCYVRLTYDSLWPSILLHMCKNLIAFMYLFILMGSN